MIKLVGLIAAVIIADMTFNVSVALLVLYLSYLIKYPRKNSISVFADHYLGTERVGKGNIFNPYREYYAYNAKYVIDGVQYNSKYLSSIQFPLGFQQITTRHAKPKGNYIQLIDSYEKHKYRRLAVLVSTILYAWAFIVIVIIAWFLLCCIK